MIPQCQMSFKGVIVLLSDGVLDFFAMIPLDIDVYSMNQGEPAFHWLFFLTLSKTCLFLYLSGARIVEELALHKLWKG